MSRLRSYWRTMDPGVRILVVFAIVVVVALVVGWPLFQNWVNRQQETRERLISAHKELAPTAVWIEQQQTEIARQDSTLKAGRLNRRARRATVERLAKMRAEAAESVGIYNARMDADSVLADSTKLPPGTRPLPRRF